MAEQISAGAEEFSGAKAEAEAKDPDILEEITNKVISALQSSQLQPEGGIARSVATPQSDNELLQAAKKECQQLYPRRLQEIEIFFGLPEHLRITHEKAERRIPRGEVAGLIAGLAEFNFLVTHYLIANATHRKRLRLFWGRLRKVARATGNPGEKELFEKLFRSFKIGVLGQAAAYHLMETSGMTPTLATPEQDAFKGIDLCGQIPGQELPVAFQVKTGGKHLKLELLGGGYNVYPIARIDKNGQLKIAEAPTPEQRFTVMKVEIRLPHDSFDMVTGLPSKKGREQFEEQLKELQQTLRDEGL